MRHNFLATGVTAVIFAICAWSPAASAAFVPGVTATTDMGTFFSYDILDMNNQSGLSTADFTAVHTNLFTDMWMGNAKTTGTVTFDLQSDTNITTIGIWNYNFQGGGTCCVDRGVKDLDIYTSTDGLSYSLLSSEILAAGTGAPIPVHLVNVPTVKARYVKFDILSNHGNSTYTGLSEVQFEGLTCEPAPYGQGCPGSGGFVPKLSASCPVAGQPVTVSIEDCLGGSPTLMFLGQNKAALPTGNGCDLLVTPILPLIIPVPLGGSGPGNGTATLTSLVPTWATGLKFTMQVFVADPASPGGYCVTNGLDWTIP